MRIRATEELANVVEVQNRLIIALTKDNAEKENMIESLFQEINLIKNWEQSRDEE